MSGRRRVTSGMVLDLLGEANACLLWRGLCDRQTGIGRLQVYSHGHPRTYEVQQVVNMGGGVRTLHPASTRREAWAFLRGYVGGFRVGHPQAPARDEEGGDL